MSTNPLLEAALEYARQGFCVFPLVPRLKRPLTDDGFYNATREEAIIRAWWLKNPNANIGIRCNGLLVGDFDGYAGQQSLNLLQEKFGELPATWTIRTGGGTEAEPKEQGFHYAYRCPADLNVRPGAGKYGYPNLDFRANDSYIVAVPSITRLPYETVDTSTVADAPEWLIAIARAGNNGHKTPHEAKEPTGKIPHGQRNDQLFRLASGLRAKGLSEDSIYDAVRAFYQNDCEHEPPIGDDELRTIAKQGTRYQPGKTSRSEETDISLVCIADVEPESVSWLWYPYIPKGKLTLLEGDPGIGKSWVGLAIATGVSVGEGLPGLEATEPAVVLLASAEDGLGDTIRPRLDAMAADVTRIHAIKGALDFGNGGLAILEGYIERVRPALVIVDPLVAYIGAGVDLHRANETRTVMAKLAEIAEKYGCAIVAVRHLTKGGTLKPIYRGLGSIDLAAACRSMLLAGCDKDDPQNRGVVHIKSNLARMGTAIGYKLKDGGFYWTGESDLTWQQILSAEDTGEVKTARDEAADFLRGELAEGPVEAAQVWRDAREAGLAEATLKRAKALLGVITRRHGETGKRGGGKFTWELPPEGNLEGQKDLGYQGDYIRDGDTLNSSSLNNNPVPETGDPLNHPEAVLGMPVESALELWRSQGAPMIHLAQGVNCIDLAKLLKQPDIPVEHLEVVKSWLENNLKGGH